METPYPPSNPAAAPGMSLEVSPSSVQILCATRPWVVFCSVMGFLGALMTLAYGIMMTFFGVVIGQPATPPPTPGGAPPPNITPFIPTLGIFYLVLAVLYLLPSAKLWKFGSAIKRLRLSGSMEDLEHVINQQRGFWKAISILIIVGFVTGVIFFLIMMMTTMATMPKPR